MLVNALLTVHLRRGFKSKVHLTFCDICAILYVKLALHSEEK